jgi:hypothetical protein
MCIEKLVKSPLVCDEFRLWRLRDDKNEGLKKAGVNYKGGQVFPSTNVERLLSGFSFDHSSNVLEINSRDEGITKYLGENFAHVLSVEENFEQAVLLRKKIENLKTVDVICAPLQRVEFSQKFDIIFCIGLFENFPDSFLSSDAKDLYGKFFQYCSNLLSPNGILIIATENQFGIKYLNGSRDGLDKPFSGIEGYPQCQARGRSFGKNELSCLIKENFSNVQFYYPFPDYRLSDCVVSEEFLSSGKAGELIAQTPSHYYEKQKPLWDEHLSVLEFNRNGIMDLFSNSFLVVASMGQVKRNLFDQEAIFFSNNRKPEFLTKTKIIKDRTNGLRVIKGKLLEKEAAEENPILTLVDSESSWMDVPSLQTQLYLRLDSVGNSLEEVFAPCKKWIDFLKEISTLTEGTFWVDGGYLDAVWQNTYFVGEGCEFIDQEWKWHERIPLNVLVIRAIYNFLFYLEKNNKSIPSLSMASGKKLIKKIAQSFDVKLQEGDFKSFIWMEIRIAELVSPSQRSRCALAFRLKSFLFNRKMWCLAQKFSYTLKRLISKVYG